MSFREMMFVSSFVLALGSSNAFAHQSSSDVGIGCSIDLNHDIHVEDNSVTVLDKGQPLYRIVGTKLTVLGKPVNLERSQTLRVVEYRSQLEQSVPEVAELVADSLSLTMEVMDVLLDEMENVGLDDSSIRETIQRLEQELTSTFEHKEGGYQIKANALRKLSDEFGEQIDERIGNLIYQSVGSFLSAMGTAMMKGDLDNFGDQLEKFGLQLEQKGEQIKKDVSEKSASLIRRADDLCQQWHQLNDLESRMIELVPVLKPYDLIVSRDLWNKHEHHKHKNHEHKHQDL